MARNVCPSLAVAVIAADIVRTMLSYLRARVLRAPLKHLISIMLGGQFHARGNLPSLEFRVQRVHLLVVLVFVFIEVLQVLNPFLQAVLMSVQG